jgi:hypothetical protein
MDAIQTFGFVLRLCHIALRVSVGQDNQNVGDNEAGDEREAVGLQSLKEFGAFGRQESDLQGLLLRTCHLPYHLFRRLNLLLFVLGPCQTSTLLSYSTSIKAKHSLDRDHGLISFGSLGA